MNELVKKGVQSIHDGNYQQVASFLNQALTENPSDVDALLGMASITINIEQKMEYLQRVAYVDPANKIARQALLEIDRQSITSTTHIPTVEIPLIGKTLIFRFSYIFPIFFFALGTLSGIAFWGSHIGHAPVYISGIFFLVAVLFIYLALSILYKVEINDKYICVVGLFGKQIINWDDITDVKKVNGAMQLFDQNGNPTIKIHLLISGYQDIVKILRFKRSDLWKSEREKVFKKSITPMILLFLIGGGFIVGGISNMIRGGDYFGGGIVIIGMGLLFIVIGLGQLGSLRISDDLLIIQDNIKHHQLPANQIQQIDLHKDIHAQTHGINVDLSIVIILKTGSPIRLRGFQDGDEIVYNFVYQWWKKQKTNSTN